MAGNENRASEIIVLAEDELHVRFVRRYLQRLGCSNHDIRVLPLPAGRGCGEQWVRDRYPAAVKQYRARVTRAKSGLVVIIDADVNSVTDRARQLAAALSSSGETARSADETIAHLIPKRHIETWVLCLSGQIVDETTDYKGRREIEGLTRESATAFYQWARSNAIRPPHCIPSLSIGIQEVRRLEPDE